MNTDANPFAGYEPNATGGTEDLGGDFDRWSGWKSRENWECVWRKRSGNSITPTPPPWPGLGMNPLGPTLRAETQTPDSSTVARRRCETYCDGLMFTCG